jgi:hypothetical protein
MIQIDETLHDALLAYLCPRPWAEVNSLIVQLLRAKGECKKGEEPKPVVKQPESLAHGVKGGK